LSRGEGWKVGTHAGTRKAFYLDVLGLTEIEIPYTFSPAGLNVRWFRLGAQQIHLLQGAENQPDSQHHMALQLDDAQGARLWMKKKLRH
jgi:hypothetical protein